MSFINEIGSWIKGWRLDKFFKGLGNGDKQTGAELQATVEKAIELVNNLKSYVESPVGDMVTTVIPGDWDNELKAKAEEFIKKVASNSGFITECTGMATAGEQLVCVYNKISSLNDDDEVDSFWHKLGVLATKVFADGKITFSDAIIAAEMVYRLIVKNKEVAVAEEQVG